MGGGGGRNKNGTTPSPATKSEAEKRMFSQAKGLKAKKIPRICVNDHLLDICFHKSIPFFSGTLSTSRKHNRNLEPFFRARDFRTT